VLTMVLDLLRSFPSRLLRFQAQPFVPKNLMALIKNVTSKA
jgi:hypothetical protein